MKISLSLLWAYCGISKYGHTAARIQSNGNLAARISQNKWSEERLVCNDCSDNPRGSKQSCQSTLELYHDQKIKGKNSCVKLDNAFSLPPNNGLFKNNHWSPWKKKITIPNNLHHRRVWSRQLFFCRVWGVKIFWVGRKTFFKAVATILCPYLARAHNQIVFVFFQV